MLILYVPDHTILGKMFIPHTLQGHSLNTSPLVCLGAGESLPTFMTKYEHKHVLMQVSPCSYVMVFLKVCNNLEK